MKSFIYSSKRMSLYCTLQDDFVNATAISGELYPNTGALICNAGGIEAFVANCQATELTLEEWIVAKQNEAKERAAYSANIQAEIAHKIEADYQELLAKNTAIEATCENLRTIGLYLAKQNWGSWTLPKLSIGYSAHQYDCDGHIAVTFTLDQPIEGSCKWALGAPRGHLEKYSRL